MRVRDLSAGGGIAAQLLQFFALSCFLLVAFRHGEPGLEDWLIAFMVGGAVAVLQVAFATMIARGRPLNRLLLGVNAYLAVGGLSASTNQLWILQALNDLRESGLFLCILAVGAVATFGSAAGFVGQVDAADPSRTRRYSFALWALALLVSIPSFAFRGHLSVSAVVPLTALTLVNRWLGKRLREGR